MSDIIQLLPDSVANQIAAGEVIQRPASVIKELMENAVDAGATVINVLVIDAGRTSIQVVDNGKGMSETDARLAFERHATSKIRKADDLFTLQTMGFRGEALPSIAAVAQVELRTRQADSELGSELEIAASKVKSQRPCSCPVGCSFKVNNLFYNIPARRKFLKSNTTELNNILTAFERIVLVYPDIHFTFHSNGSEVFNLRPGNLKQRISDVFGKKISQNILSVDVDTTVCKIRGFVGKPEFAKKKNAQQYFFVNGRYMRHLYFASAVQAAYDRLVPKGEHVPFFIYMDVPPADIDVNIHPAKTEIKFENEQAIWQILSAATREAVGVFSDITAIDFDVEGRPEIPMFEPDGAGAVPTSVTSQSFNPSYNPFKSEAKKSTKVEGWQALYPSLGNARQNDIPSSIFDDGSDLASNELEDLSSDFFQLKGQYIIASVRGGMLVADQHRAHVRVLFEQYSERIAAHKSLSQRMLFPEAVQFEAANQTLLDSIIEEMNNMGFELTPLGARNYAINAVPMGMEGINPSALVQDMVDDAIMQGATLRDDINNALATSMAHKSAIPHGQVLSVEEMSDLIKKLFACKNVNYTPDGRKIFYIIKQDDIQKNLG